MIPSRTARKSMNTRNYSLVSASSMQSSKTEENSVQSAGISLTNSLWKISPSAKDNWKCCWMNMSKSLIRSWITLVLRLTMVVELPMTRMWHWLKPFCTSTWHRISSSISTLFHRVEHIIPPKQVSSPITLTTLSSFLWTQLQKFSVCTIMQKSLTHRISLGKDIFRINYPIIYQIYNILFLCHSRVLLETILSVQPRTSKGAGMSREEKIEEIANFV